MSREYDIEKFVKDPDTSELSLLEVTRPSINKNSIGPLNVGHVVEIKIFKNSELAVKFIYTVVKDIPSGKRLYAAATLRFWERDLTHTVNDMNEVIVCKDSEVLVKNPETGEMTPDYILRPRNVRRNNIGGYKLNDECRVELLIDNNLLDSMDYKVTNLGTDKQLLAEGSVDFVEMNWA